MNSGTDTIDVTVSKNAKKLSTTQLVWERVRQTCRLECEDLDTGALISVPRADDIGGALFLGIDRGSFGTLRLSKTSQAAEKVKQRKQTKVLDHVSRTDFWKESDSLISQRDPKF
jgi:hypothetical protein